MSVSVAQIFPALGKILLAVTNYPPYKFSFPGSG
jgi:hypothetical protein